MEHDSLAGIDDPRGDHEDRLASPQAEAVLVAAILSLTDPDPDLLDRVDPDSFADPHAGAIWSAARTVRDAGKLISPRNIAAHTSGPGVASRLAAASRIVADPHRVVDAERTVNALWRRRQVRLALSRALERVDLADDASEALEMAHTELAKLTTAASERSGAVWFDTAAAEWWEWIDSPKQSDGRVIETPWAYLDERIAGGLHTGRTYVVGGRPGGGKSIAGANMALHAAERGHTAIMFSVEMGRREVMSRLIASGSRTSYGRILGKHLSDEDFARVGEYLNTNGRMNLAVVDKPNINTAYIAATCRAIKRQRGLDVVFVDYLQLLGASDPRVPRERQVANMSRDLKILARELDVAVIIACQLNRQSASGDRPPALADLRESGAIEQDADVVILLHRKDEFDGDIQFVVAKNRTGPPGVVTQHWAAHQSRIA